MQFLVFQITALKIKYNPFAKAFLDAKERWENSNYKYPWAKKYAERWCCCIPSFLNFLLFDNSIYFFFVCFDRSDHKEMMEETGDSQQPGYSQCTVCCTLSWHSVSSGLDLLRAGKWRWRRQGGFWVRLKCEITFLSFKALCPVMLKLCCLSNLCSNWGCGYSP